MVVTVQERPLPFPPDPPPNPGTGHPAPKPGLYSDRLKTNITWDNRLKRNVLEITLEKEEESFTDIGSESIARLFKTLGINIETEIEGYFQKSRSIQLWLANGVDLDRFCKNESIRVTDTIRTGFIRPAGKKEVTVTVSGLDFNTPDKFVMDYLKKFGNVIKNYVIYDRYKEGTFRGKCNGDRKYQVDFTQSNITMGTYHIIDGSRVRIHYPGNKKTCGRCHRTADQCRGDAVAKSCEENQGVRVELQDHMKCLWERVGFHPHNFQLNGDGVNDAIIKESSNFSPIINRPELTEDEKNKFNGIALKNFPKETKKVDIIELFKTNGLPEGFPQERIVFGNHGNVEIRNLPAPTCQEIIKNIHFPESRKKYFGKPIYCRATRDLTPSKATEGTQAASEEATEKVTVDEVESTVETDYDGFIFGPINNIDSKLLNGDSSKSTDGDSDDDQVPPDLAQRFRKSPKTPSLNTTKKRNRGTPNSSSSQKVDKKKTKTL